MTWGILALTAVVALGYALWPLARRMLAERRDRLAGRRDDSWNAHVDAALRPFETRALTDAELDAWMTGFERQEARRRR